MYIYKSGLIGEAVRAKIDGIKSSVHGTGQSSSESFGDVLKSMMTVEKEEVKPVGGYTSTPSTESDAPQIIGDVLLYALQNYEGDTTASAVLSALGYGGYTGGTDSLKTSADALLSSAKKLTGLSSADKGTQISAVSDFVTKYNDVMTKLGSISSTSSYMYLTGLRSIVSANSEGLLLSGVTAGSDGKLSFDENNFIKTFSDEFLGNLVSASGTLSTYADSIAESADKSLNLLGDSEEDDGNFTSSYYNALMGIYS